MDEMAFFLMDGFKREDKFQVNLVNESGRWSKNKGRSQPNLGANTTWLVNMWK